MRSPADYFQPPGLLRVCCRHLVAATTHQDQTLNPPYMPLEAPADHPQLSRGLSALQVSFPTTYAPLRLPLRRGTRQRLAVTGYHHLVQQELASSPPGCPRHVCAPPSNRLGRRLLVPGPKMLPWVPPTPAPLPKTHRRSQASPRLHTELQQQLLQQLQGHIQRRQQGR